jgi:hypothetical protein
VICLDSGCGNYEQLWMTTSLRGSIVGNLTVEVLTEGVHSGDASGIVPSSFSILRELLDRLEDATSGQDHPGVAARRSPAGETRRCGGKRRVLGATRLLEEVPLHRQYAAGLERSVELLLNRTWRPALAYTGQAGMPDLVQGGNVLRPVHLAEALAAHSAEPRRHRYRPAHQDLLESDPPHGAKVTFEPEKGGAGWVAPPTAPWLEQSVERGIAWPGSARRR